MTISFPLRTIVDLFFRLLILSLLIRVILSWVITLFPVSPGNPFSRFFNGLTDPILQPIASRIPRASFRALDLSLIVALIFSWWALSLLDGLVLAALPGNW